MNKTSSPTLQEYIKHHSLDCYVGYENARQAILEWEAKYPGWCGTCGGCGWNHWTENGAPYGAGFWPMPMAEGCDNCLGQNKCPRCGYQILPPNQDTPEDGGMWLNQQRDFSEPCLNCGWWSDDQHPSEWECWGDCTRRDDE